MPQEAFTECSEIDDDNKNPGIYVHIPFCVRKCNYCAFLSGTSDEAPRERREGAVSKRFASEQGL